MFPTSDIRSANPPRFASAATPLAARLPHNTAQADDSVCIDVSFTKYSTAVPLRTQIAPGIWWDGSSSVLSAACPTVQAFLTCARRNMKLPAAPSEPVFALAALEVFYRTDDPVHWMFWSDEKKHHTAEVVSRISLHRPQLIHSRVAWNGTREYLFILSSLHGPTSLPLYENKDWYPILNPSKVPSPPRVLNLRKRKIQPVVEQTEILNGEDGIDPDEPRPKRSKTKASANPKPSQAPGPRANSLNDETEKPDVSPAATSTSLPTEDGDSLPSESPTMATPDDDAHSPAESSRVTRGNSRRQTRKARESSTRDPSPILRATSESSSPASSALLTPAVIVSHSRNRSSSQASSQTFVAESERRSVSVLSAITAVEILTVGADVDEAIKVDQAVLDSEEKEEEEEGMVTRGRANKARGKVVRRKSPVKSRGKRKGGVK
ncbi:hypothetical protein Hypma_007781 [Hypsizygus marmoreus]|uniref:Uncharacterized protein n=1 Tax=Hypsizygus marmoreus TaxID=39966 RepID=A0A369JZZ7_HYPMA|nr:hypothetical protein Hypma_007781 [Hypsizygus marmoreus]